MSVCAMRFPYCFWRSFAELNIFSSFRFWKLISTNDIFCYVNSNSLSGIIEDAKAVVYDKSDLRRLYAYFTESCHPLHVKAAAYTKFRESGQTKGAIAKALDLKESIVRTHQTQAQF